MRKDPNSRQRQKLRETLIAMRQEAGVTQAALARRIGRQQSFVSKYESGERYLDVVEFVEICEALGASPATALRRARGVN